MSLKLQPIQPVPEETARIARAAFRKGNPLLQLRDELGTIFSDADFAGLFPQLGQPGLPPWRLALITILQFRENLADRQAAEAVRARIDWKYLLGLELADPGFDHSVLCEFRARLGEGGAVERLLHKLLERCRELGILKARGRQRTDATHVLAAIRVLNRLELVGETLRAALNELAAVAPDWLRGIALEAWYERYAHRVEDGRLPVTPAKREAYARQVGGDGFHLLDALAAPGTPEELNQLPAILALRRVWARHFERVEDGGDPSIGSAGARLRAVRGRGHGDDRVESPYDLDARFRSKGGMGWTGYTVHLTETCDDDTPRLVVHVDTTPATVHEAMRTDAIHAALGAKDLTPSEHLVDAGYVSAGHLVGAHERHGIDLVGPTRKEASWQRRTAGGFGIGAFAIDWERKRARCPEGKESTSWREYEDEARGRFVRARFSPADCHACPSKPLCTRTKRQGRQLAFHAREEREALEAARARQATAAGQRLRALRQGIESTISQGVRAFGMRQARYRGLVKTHLQHVATAAALNLERTAAWLEGRPLAPTRISRFAALAA
jgi:transposase